MSFDAFVLNCSCVKEILFQVFPFLLFHMATNGLETLASLMKVFLHVPENIFLGQIV